MPRQKKISMGEAWAYLEDHYDEFADYRGHADDCWQVWDDAHGTFAGKFPTLKAAVDHQIRQYVRQEITGRPAEWEPT